MNTSALPLNPKPTEATGLPRAPGFVRKRIALEAISALGISFSLSNLLLGCILAGTISAMHHGTPPAIVIGIASLYDSPASLFLLPFSDACSILVFLLVVGLIASLLEFAQLVALARESFDLALSFRGSLPHMSLRKVGALPSSMRDAELLFLSGLESSANAVFSRIAAQPVGTWKLMEDTICPELFGSWLQEHGELAQQYDWMDARDEIGRLAILTSAFRFCFSITSILLSAKVLEVLVGLCALRML